MNATLIPHDFYKYIHGFFEINTLTLCNNPLASICLVFWRGNKIAFKNGYIKDALFIDEEIIELEILRPSGKISYHYYNPSLRKSVVIPKRNSEILSLRILHNINTIINEQKTLYEEG